MSQRSTVSGSKVFLPVVYILIAGSMAASACSFAAGIESEADKKRLLESHGIVQYRFDDDFKIRGWRLTPQVYFGQAKIAKEWGIGLMVERPGYAYGINNERLSVIMHF